MAKPVSISIQNLIKAHRSELEKAKQRISDELERRDNAESVFNQVASILNNHNFDIDELLEIKNQFHKKNKSTPKGQQKVRKGKSKTNVRRRRSPEAKYHDGEMKKMWSGRGRLPKWAMEICEEEQITEREFKDSPKYKV